jgi:hypothetical protein
MEGRWHGREDGIDVNKVDRQKGGGREVEKGGEVDGG